MNCYTFTSWDQIESWIKNNGLVKWYFATGQGDGEQEGSRKLGNVIANSEWYDGEQEVKLRMTRMQLESQAGRYLYGYGYHTTNGTMGCCVCEIQLPGNQIQQPGVQGIGAPQIYQPAPVVDREELKRELTAQIKYEIGRETLEAERKAFEKERDEFRKDQEGVWGVAIHYLKPLAQQLLQSRGQRVAGLDTTMPEVPEVEEQGAEEPEVFTEQEEEELFALMARFKQVEPDYMTMLCKVVEMAEARDAMYATAKKFLC